MAHLAALYKLSVRPHGNPSGARLLLGNLDGAHSSLHIEGPRLAKGISQDVMVDGLPDPQTEVAYARPVDVQKEHTFGFIIEHSGRGDKGVLHLYHQDDMVTFTEVDARKIEAGCVIHAPPNRENGFLAIHFPNRVSVKHGLKTELSKILRDEYGLYLEMEPVVPLDALEAAVSDHGIFSLQFKRLDNPEQLFGLDHLQWSEAEEVGTLTYVMLPQRGRAMGGQKLLKFLRWKKGEPTDEPVTASDLVTFDDVEYDEIVVEVLLEGRKKKIRIDKEGAESASVFKWDLDLGSTASPEQCTEALLRLIPD